MTSQAQIDNIKAYFVHTTDEIPKISTASDPPTFTSLQAFQDAINANAMAVPAPDTDLGHAALTMKTSHFTVANGGAYTDPTSPGTSPTNPNTTLGAATRTNPTVPHDPFVAQEKIR